jgi:protein TonB
MDLQSNLFHSRKEKKKRGRYAVASLVAHGLLVTGVVWAGATATSHIASEKPIRAFLTQGAAPPPPPPPPPPPAASHSAPKQVTQVQPKIVQPTFVQPREIPQEVPKVEIPQTPVDPTPAVTTSTGADGGQPGGVVGGVAGGVPGGTVGGEVGGQIGGVVGGTLGGQVGGTGTGTEGNGSGGTEAPSGPLRVGGDVKAPIALNRVQPEYTETARKGRISGVVVLEAIINKDGTVEQVRVLKGLPMGLSEKAEEAVKGWKFKPGTLGGQPVDVIFSLTVNFKLDQ